MRCGFVASLFEQFPLRGFCQGFIFLTLDIAGEPRGNFGDDPLVDRNAKLLDQDQFPLLREGRNGNDAARLATFHVFPPVFAFSPGENGLQHKTSESVANEQEIFFAHILSASFSDSLNSS